MNDRELLEAAAKAHGKIHYDRSGLADVFLEFRDNHMYHWNPLEDDGDALRLAMQLQMTLELGHKGCIVKMWGWPEVSEMCHPDSSDNPECTRRAIVRAAAQIGEVLP